MTSKIDDMPIRKIDHVRFFVGNARQSAYFYRNAYGFDVVAYAGLETKVKNEAGYVLKQGGRSKPTVILPTPLSIGIGTMELLHRDSIRLILLATIQRLITRPDFLQSIISSAMSKRAK